MSQKKGETFKNHMIHGTKDVVTPKTQKTPFPQTKTPLGTKKRHRRDKVRKEPSATGWR
jgi:hypothetical protein